VAETLGFRRLCVLTANDGGWHTNKARVTGELPPAGGVSSTVAILALLTRPEPSTNGRGNGPRPGKESAGQRR